MSQYGEGMLYWVYTKISDSKKFLGFTIVYEVF